MARCTGGFAKCVAQRFELLAHFVGRGSMDIETVGAKLAWTLIDKGLVYDPGDLYSLTREQLVGLERMGDKSAQNVLDNVERSKQRSLTSVLFALGIRYVGYQNAELLARAFGSMDQLRQASLEDILAVEGIGPKIAESVHAWFRDADNLRVVDKLVAAGVNMVEASASRQRPTRGPDHRGHGSTRAPHARADRAAHQGPRRRGRRLGLQEDELRAWPARMPARSSARRRSWARRSSTRRPSTRSSPSARQA